MGFPSAKEIVELIKTGATIEAQEKVMELRLSAMEMQEENIRLRSHVLELEEQIRELKSEDGEKCPNCGKRTWRIESSKPHPLFGEVGKKERVYKCTECGFSETGLAD